MVRVALIATLACSLPSPAPAADGASEFPTLLGAAELRDLLKKADKRLDKAAGALRGRDAGRVSLILRAADDHLAHFETGSGLVALVEAFEEARSAGEGNDMTAAASALGRIREITPSLTDYAVTRETEVAFRAARAATESADPALFPRSLARLEASILAPVLLARVREARAAIGRARAAMVHRDMPTGRTETATARRAIDGLRYAGALSRAVFALRVSSELLREAASIAARDQARRGLRDLRTAVELAPEAQRDQLAQARSEATAIWKRMNRPRPDDATQLEEVSRTIETVRREQG